MEGRGCAECRVARVRAQSLPVDAGNDLHDRNHFPLVGTGECKALSFLRSTYSRIHRGELDDRSMCSLLGILIIATHSCHFVFWADNFVILLSRFAIGSTWAHTFNFVLYSKVDDVLRSIVFSAFRVYAVSGRKVLPTLVVTFLSTIPIIISLVGAPRLAVLESQITS